MIKLRNLALPILPGLALLVAALWPSRNARAEVPDVGPWKWIGGPPVERTGGSSYYREEGPSEAQLEAQRQEQQKLREAAEDKRLGTEAMDRGQWAIAVDYLAYALERTPNDESARQAFRLAVQKRKAQQEQYVREYREKLARQKSESSAAERARNDEAAAAELRPEIGLLAEAVGAVQQPGEAPTEENSPRFKAASEAWAQLQGAAQVWHDVSFDEIDGTRLEQLSRLAFDTEGPSGDPTLVVSEPGSGRKRAVPRDVVTSNPEIRELVGNAARLQEEAGELEAQRKEMLKSPADFNPAAFQHVLVRLAKVNGSLSMVKFDLRTKLAEKEAPNLGFVPGPAASPPGQEGGK